MAATGDHGTLGNFRRPEMASNIATLPRPEPLLQNYLRALLLVLVLLLIRPTILGA